MKTAKNQPYWLLEIAILIQGLIVSAASAESLWITGGNRVGVLEQVSGLSSGGRGHPVIWKESQVRVAQPDILGGAYPWLGVIEKRTACSLQSEVLLSFDGLFGEAPAPLPANARIQAAQLWIYLEQNLDSPLITLAGFSPADADWDPAQVSYGWKHLERQTAWSGAGSGPNYVKVYGAFRPALAPGWFGVPVDLAPALEDLRRGLIGGLGLRPSGIAAEGIRNCYFASTQATDAERRPGLYVVWQPSGSAQRTESQTVADENLIVSAMPGAMRVQMKGNSGQALRLEWAGLAGWRYVVEAADNIGGPWVAVREPVVFSGGVPGICPQSLGSQKFYRVKAIKE